MPRMKTTGECVIDGCGRPLYCVGLCARHYMRLYKRGRTDLLPRHGHARALGTPTYRCWQSIKARCLNPSCADYSAYGGRGIRVCGRWRDSFAAFLADMGERPNGKTIDRIDNDRGYEPSNCRWATPKEQAANRRRPRRAA